MRSAVSRNTGVVDGDRAVDDRCDQAVGHDLAPDVVHARRAGLSDAQVAGAGRVRRRQVQRDGGDIVGDRLDAGHLHGDRAARRHLGHRSAGALAGVEDANRPVGRVIRRHRGHRGRRDCGAAVGQLSRISDRVRARLGVGVRDGRAGGSGRPLNRRGGAAVAPLDDVVDRGRRPADANGLMRVVAEGLGHRGAQGDAQRTGHTGPSGHGRLV